MKISTIIIGIILFAIATMIIYGWGLVKQRNQTGDLTKMLFGKGESQIKKYLKKNEYITKTDVERICGGLEVRMPFSTNRAVVKDKKNFAAQLLAYMERTGQLKKDGAKYIQVKK